MMHIDDPAKPCLAQAAIGSDDLVEGLMLVRASTLKMIRLQLALDRRDRHVALESLDDLVALDRRLRDYLANVPAVGDQILFRPELEAERAMLNHEKLTLAAEVLCRAPEPLVEEPELPNDDWLGPRDLPLDPEPRRGRWWLAAIPIAASALAASLYFAQPSLAALAEVLR